MTTHMLKTTRLEEDRELIISPPVHLQTVTVLLQMLEKKVADTISLVKPLVLWMIKQSLVTSCKTSLNTDAPTITQQTKLRNLSKNTEPTLDAS